MLERTPYPEGFMDESLALAARIAMVQTNPRLEEQHCAVIGDALRRADAQVAELLRATR